MAEKYDPEVNWTTGVVMDKNSPQYGRPQVVAEYSTFQNGQDVNTKASVLPRSAPRTSSRRRSRR